MEKLKLSALAGLCGGRLTGADIDITGVSTDSRKLKPGDLFVAIRGESFDGHDFLETAAETCAAVLSARAMPLKVPMLLADDTLKALQDIAAGYRRRFSPRILALTGSVGKTTTKEMCASVLSRRFETLKTQGNFNNHLGLPLTLLNMDSGTRAAVLEMGANHFGEIALLTRLAAPDVALITNIGSMHLEFFGSRQGVLRAKTEIFQGLPPEGHIILNGDDDLLWAKRDSLGHRTLWFGCQNPLCDVRAQSIREDAAGVTFTLRAEGVRQEVCLPVRGRHNVLNALAAAAAGLDFGLNADNICQGLAAFVNTGMRQRIYFAGGYTIIEDCYNAGPDSTAAALEVLSGTPGNKHIAVLGDMLELGESSARCHRKVLDKAESVCDRVFLYGEAFGEICPQRRFGSHAALAEALRAEAREGDVILFKGSRSMRMEQSLKMFLEGRT